jgi:hypothetical protein
METKIRHIFSETVKEWKRSLEAINRAVFSGDETSISILTKLVQDGRSLNRDPGDKSTFGESANKFLYSALIPATWRMQGYYPVLLDMAFPCKTPGIGIRQWTGTKKLDNQIVCYNDIQFQMFAIKGNDPCAQADAISGGDCKRYLIDLPGLKEIQVKNDLWGGLDQLSLTTR